MQVKLIFSFIFCQLLALIGFFFLILLFVDTSVIKSPLIGFHYLFSFQSTYTLSVPSFVLFNLVFVAVVLVELFKDSAEYGDARFATDNEINNMKENGLFESKGTILAKKSNRYIRTNESLSVLIIAPQGTGKTAAVIIPTLFSDTSSFLINDVKGELWDITSKQRSHFGRVGLFAPSKNLKDGLSWNPLDKKCLPKHFDDQIDFVDRVANILYPTEQDGMDATTKHFNGEAKGIFNYFALTLIVKNGGTSLPEIFYSALESGDMQSAIALDKDENEDNWNSNIILLANGLLEKGGNEWQSCVTTFKQALEPFSRPNVARNLKSCDFTHEDFKSDKPFSLYLFIPANDISRMAPIVRMLVEYLVNEFLSLTDKEVIDRQRVVFCMDEFPRMGYMKSLKEAPALQRSFKMASIFVAQDKNQIETTYGKGSFDQFVTTTDFKVIFRQNEDTTAQRFSTLIGKTTRKKLSISKKDLDWLGSSSENAEGVPLILPQDFMSQTKNKLILLISGYHERPINSECAWWFKDKDMLKLAGSYNDLTISDLAIVNTHDTSNAVNNDVQVQSESDNDLSDHSENVTIDEKAIDDTVITQDDSVITQENIVFDKSIVIEESNESLIDNANENTDDADNQGLGF